MSCGCEFCVNGLREPEGSRNGTLGTLSQHGSIAFYRFAFESGFNANGFLIDVDGDVFFGDARNVELNDVGGGVFTHISTQFGGGFFVAPFTVRLGKGTFEISVGAGVSSERGPASCGRTVETNESSHGNFLLKICTEI